MLLMSKLGESLKIGNTSIFENFRKAMRWMLARIMVLNLLSLYTLIIALFDKTGGMMERLLEMQDRMKNQGMDFGLDLANDSVMVPRDCFKVPIPCELLEKRELFGIPIAELERSEYNMAISYDKGPVNSTIVLMAPNNVYFDGNDCSADCLDDCGTKCEYLCNVTCGNNDHDFFTSGDDDNTAEMINIEECKACIFDFANISTNTDTKIMR